MGLRGTTGEGPTDRPYPRPSIGDCELGYYCNRNTGVIEPESVQRCSSTERYCLWVARRSAKKTWEVGRCRIGEWCLEVIGARVPLARVRDE